MPGARWGGAVLYVKDLPALTAFYVAVLEVPVVSRDHDHAVLAVGGASFTLVQVPPHVAAGIVIAQPPQRREDTPIKPVFNVTDLQRARERVNATGGEMNRPERQWSWQGRTVCDGHDPEGNVFQLSAPAG